jgi:hypothetical protein
MNFEKVLFGFFVVLAATLNFGFFIGDIADPRLHNQWELYAALTVNLIATILKFGDRTQIGAVHLATSLVADIQLIAATIVFVWASSQPTGLDAHTTSAVVSLSGGALLANLVSMTLLVIDTTSFRRR